jgi:phage terminase large subunit
VNIEVAPVFWPLLEPARYKCAYGGRGSAKSHFFAGLAVSQAAFSQRRILCLREYQKSLSMSVKSLIEMKISDFGLDDEFEIQGKRILSRCGSLIVFEGMQSHNAHSIKSFEDFDVAWFEEAQTASQRSLDILRPTLRKEGSELWFGWNPDQASDPVEFLVSDPPPGCVSVRANWRDNPWFPEVLRTELEYDKRRDPDKYNHVWEGGYRKSSAARVFSNWRIEEFDVSEIPDLGGPYGGADWGFSIDPTVLLRSWVDDVARRIYVDQEVWALNCAIADTPELFDKIEGARTMNIRADSARPETIDHMRKAGFNIFPARKGAGSVEDGVEFLKGYDILVHPRCKHVIDELTHYSWETDRLTGEPTNKLADKANHTIDALRYALENVRRSVHEFW